MNTTIVELAQHILRRLDQYAQLLFIMRINPYDYCYTPRTPASSRILVGIAGVPASGKSTFTQLLTSHINHALESLPEESISRAILVGLDGWHYTRAQLDLFPDPISAHNRRGSHWTFDGPGYVEFLGRLRENTKNDTVISAPSFDHALKDPIPDDVIIHPYHRIVIIEGLYVFLAIEPWKKASMMLDERCLIEVDAQDARKRLIIRHVVTGVAKDISEANWRAEENDIPSLFISLFLFLVDHPTFPYRWSLFTRKFVGTNVGCPEQRRPYL